MEYYNQDKFENEFLESRQLCRINSNYINEDDKLKSFSQKINEEDKYRKISQ